MNSYQTLPLNPYPGLRPYDEEHHMLFFGREMHVAQILNRLSEEKFIAIIGESGCGKSSLVRAGVLPALRGGLMDGSGGQWISVKMRPGPDPIQALAVALSDCGNTDAEKAREERLAVETTLRFSSKGLIEVSNRMLRDKRQGTRIVLLVDQFEEIFTYRDRDETRRNAVAAFIDLILGAADHANSGIYVIITMRLDFLRDCTSHPRLTEALNASEYLVPPMRREERREAIERPARLFSKTIRPRLIEKVLNDVGDAADQLPVLQHAMMRAWQRASDFKEVDLQHYETTGGALAALSTHANELYEALPNDELRTTTERLFKALSETTPNGRIIRRPCRRGLLVDPKTRW